jgi:hypothetical protein
MLNDLYYFAPGNIDIEIKKKVIALRNKYEIFNILMNESVNFNN